MAVPSLKRCKALKRNRQEHSALSKRHPQQVPTGQIYPAETDFVRVNHGKSKDPRTGLVYDLDRTPGGLPMITSGRTGKIWNISWDDLVDLAVAAGIDKGAD
ncbi:MAG: hypothetical protein ACRDTD_04085 [Pseudonocardiaceae bacterium]